ncbi:hypothetical protein E0500_042225 [Streptomyces sp. KM273126]|nr:hypothetical protein [Streptomyces sp. KM273126]
MLVAGHASRRDDFRVSCRELDLVVDTALSAGALGARMTGGGFGSSVIVLTEVADVETKTKAVGEAFATAGLTRPRVFKAVPAARGPAGGLSVPVASSAPHISTGLTVFPGGAWAGEGRGGRSALRRPGPGRAAARPLGECLSAQRRGDRPRVWLPAAVHRDRRPRPHPLSLRTRRRVARAPPGRADHRTPAHGRPRTAGVGVTPVPTPFAPTTAAACHAASPAPDTGDGTDPEGDNRTAAPISELTAQHFPTAELHPSRQCSRSLLF